MIANRVNSGSFSVSSTKANGRKSSRYVTCNSINGKADLELFLYLENEDGVRIPHIIFMELKTETGKQSGSQKAFQKMVEERGYTYIVARSLTEAVNSLFDLKDRLKEVLPEWELVIGRIKERMPEKK